MNIPHPPENILGIVGRAASGKDQVASVLEGFGYRHISLSGYVREEIAHRGKVVSRKLQTAVANEMRQREGSSYWINLALLNNSTEKVVLSGLYAPGEGEYLIDALGGTLVGVVASHTPEEDLALRYQRLSKRADGTRDTLTIDEFKEAHIREDSGTTPHETNISALLSMAHFVIHNASDLEHLRNDVLDVVLRLNGDEQ